MIHKFSGVLLLVFLSCFCYAQDNAIYGGIQPDKSVSDTSASPSELIFTPTVGAGVGMFSFYGDLYNKHFQAPMTSRLAFDLNVSQPITDAFHFNFYVLFGKLGANERMVLNNRNLNFESQIRAGGVNVMYNFDHFLPSKRTASPFVTLGVESFEFLSKTDLKDKNGNTYYYWTDGSTRSKDEYASDASTSIELKRDYTYESDVRELNLDGFGKYPERSFAIPVGVGVIYKLNDFMNFKLGTSMHFTFTDYIDGVTDRSVGNRQGDSKNDKFMMTSFSLQYNFGSKQKEKRKAIKELQQNYENIDFLALENDDHDGDGVIDFKDLCGGTPKGAEVDANGCPLDGDEDGVANYKDDELKTRKGAIVTTRGVELTDSLIAYQYNFFMDSTGMFGLVENRDINEIKEGQKEYAVKLGTFKKGLSPQLMTKFLSINDISSASTDNAETIYTAGKFDSYEAAEARKQQLIKDGLTDLSIVYKQNSKYYDADQSVASAGTTKETVKPGVIEGKFVGADKTPLANAEVNVINEKGEIIQSGTTDAFGAFHFNYLPPDQKVLILLDETDPQLKKLKKVFFTDNQGTESKEIYPTRMVYNMASTTDKGYALAKNSTKFKTATGTTGTATAAETNTSAINTPGVVLRVQLGAYKRKLSKNVFRGIDDLIEVKTDDGLYKYMTGSYTSMDAAAKRKVEMLTNGYPGAFIAAYKDGKRISLEEAGATLSGKEKVVETAENTTVSGANKNLVKFKVQVGVFKNQPPDSKLAIFAKLKDLKGEKTKSGLTKYVVGTFTSYKDAEAFKAELIKKYALNDAFVVALFNNEYITVQEAMELLK